MNLDFEKQGGLIPAIIQDAVTNKVLMLGYMNKESLDKTIETNKVCFYSRSRNCLWTKGETYVTVFAQKNVYLITITALEIERLCLLLCS